VPRGAVGIAGVTAIETIVAEVTVNVVEPEIAPDVAVTLALPVPTLLARPWALTVAIA